VSFSVPTRAGALALDVIFLTTASHAWLLAAQVRTESRMGGSSVGATVPL
jgi:hypothetical protein